MPRARPPGTCRLRPRAARPAWRGSQRRRQHHAGGAAGLVGGGADAADIVGDLPGRFCGLGDVAGDLGGGRALLLDRGADRGGDAADLLDGGGDAVDGVHGLPGRALDLGDLVPISRVASAVWLASDFTSEATTAKPRPASPARAASMVALSASRLVCAAMWRSVRRRARSAGRRPTGRARWCRCGVRFRRRGR